MRRVVVTSVFLVVALSSGAVLAQERGDDVVPCLGPMCAFTPIYRVRKAIMPEDISPAPTPMPATSATPAAPAAPSVAPPSAQATPASPADVGSAQPVQGGPAPSAPSDETADANTGDATSPARVHTSRHAWSRMRTSRVARRSGHAPGAGTVTIAANGIEMGRLLALASVVRSPRVRLVSARAPFEGCRGRPADFVVDTMSDPDRLGPAIPLFTESLIVVARDGVHDIRDLDGKQVSFGLPGGSSERVARRVFAALKIAPHEIPLDVGNALDGLSLGDLDAVALLVPRGSNVLAHRDAKLHLLALPDGMVPPDGLKLSRIEPSVYLGAGWSQQGMAVVTVDAVLSPRRPADMQPVAQALYAALDRRAPQLASNGFDLIGGGDGLTTMRSVAKDVDTRKRAPSDPGC